MKNARLELKKESKRYMQLKHSKTFQLGIKDELNSGEKSTIEIEEAKIEIKNKVKYKLKIIHEIKNEEKLKSKKNEKSQLKMHEKLKLNKEIQTNNIINTSNLPNKSNIIAEGFTKNQTSSCTSSFKFEKRREDKKVAVQCEEPQIKHPKKKLAFLKVII